MIDPTNEIFTYVSQEVRNRYSTEFPYLTLKQVPEETLASTSLPFVWFRLVDNPMYQPTQDSGSMENHVQALFEVDVFASGNSKLNTCKKITAVIDGKMQSYGFIRIFGPQQVDNLSDTSVCRLKTRYQGVIGNKDQNGTYLVYKR